MARDQFQIAGRNDGRLYRAVVCGDHRTVIEELRQGGIDPDLSIGGRTLLHHAGDRGFRQIVWHLINHGANPNHLYGKQQRRLLHYAAATQNYGFASVLLEAKADVSPRTSFAATPLHFSARLGQDYLTQLLIKHGADVDAQDSNGRTPLYLAVAKGYSHIAKRLIATGSDIRIPDRRGVSAKQVAETIELEL